MTNSEQYAPSLILSALAFAASICGIVWYTVSRSRKFVSSSCLFFLHALQSFASVQVHYLSVCIRCVSSCSYAGLIVGVDTSASAGLLKILVLLCMDPSRERKTCLTTMRMPHGTPKRPLRPCRFVSACKVPCLQYFIHSRCGHTLQFTPLCNLPCCQPLLSTLISTPSKFSDDCPLECFNCVFMLHSSQRDSVHRFTPQLPRRHTHQASG